MIVSRKELKNIYIVSFIIILIITLLLFSNNLHLLLIGILCVYVSILYFKREDILEVFYLLILFLYPDYNVFFKIVGWDFTSIFFILSLYFLFLKVIKNLLNKRVILDPTSMIIILVIIYSVLGIVNNGYSSNTFYDIKIFIVFISIYLIIKENKLLINTSFEKLSFIINFLLIIFWIIISSIFGIENLREGTTISVPVFTALILLLPYSIIYMFNSKRKTLLIIGILDIFVSIYFLIEVKSRTVFYIVLLEIPLTLIYLFINKNYIRAKKRIFLIFIFVIPIVLILFGLDLKVQNFSETFGRLFDKNLLTLEFRIKTIQLGINQIKENIFGSGFGTTLLMYTDELYFPIKVLRADNLFLTLGVKMGLIGGLIFVFLYFYNLILVLNKKSDRAHKTFEIIVIVLFLFTTTIMSAQLVYAYSITTVFWVYLISNKKGVK